jgi:hypothetical protein
MAYSSIKQLASMTLHATESIVYSAPASRSVEIASMWFHNPTAAIVTAQMWFPFTASVPTASFSASNAIQRMSEGFSGSVSLEISPKVPFVLNSSGSGAFADKITMKCSQTSSLNVVIYGREDI